MQGSHTPVYMQGTNYAMPKRMLQDADTVEV